MLLLVVHNPNPDQQPLDHPFPNPGHHNLHRLEPFQKLMRHRVVHNPNPDQQPLDHPFPNTGHHNLHRPAHVHQALVHPHHAVAAQKVVVVAVVAVAVAVGVVRVVKIAVVKPSLYHRSWLRTNERQTEKLEQFFVE